MTSSRLVRVGWVRQTATEFHACAKHGRDDQQCSGSARYLVEVEHRGERWTGRLCANHLAASAADLGIDMAKITEWKDLA